MEREGIANVWLKGVMHTPKTESSVAVEAMMATPEMPGRRGEPIARAFLTEAVLHDLEDGILVRDINRSL